MSKVSALTGSLLGVVNPPPKQDGRILHDLIPDDVLERMAKVNESNRQSSAAVQSHEGVNKTQAAVDAFSREVQAHEGVAKTQHLVDELTALVRKPVG